MEVKTDYQKQRESYILTLKESGINPYPHKFNVTKNLEEFRITWDYIKNGERLEDNKESVAGRVNAIRKMGNLYFISIQTILDNGIHYLQLIFSIKNNVYNKKEVETISRGDIIGANGFVGKSHKGELSLIVETFQILTPCLTEVPTSHFGIQDVEIIARKRFMDLAINKNAMEPFIIHNKVIKFLRNYLDNKGFFEVQTPILSDTYGGANACPFMTFHNSLKKNMYLRISPELNLKKAIIGGIERVYEIGAQFRNEDIDTTHMPEFISMELYQAYADYFDMMDTTEDMLSTMVKEIIGSYIVNYKTINGTEINIDFNPPYQKIDIISRLENDMDVKFPNDLSSTETTNFLIEQCNKFNVFCSEPKTNSRMIDKLVGHFIEPFCINPTFLINHPAVMSPLAKIHRENSQLTERFELFINCAEYCNAYTEQNDVFIQHQAFEKQVEDRKHGDNEGHMYDETFIDALKFGLPPTCGFGLGVTRLIMLLSNKTNIKDVILFPPMK